MDHRRILALAGIPFAFAACAKEAPPPPPPPEVKVALVIQRDLPVYVEAIGETRGNTEIEIRARVEGFIETVEFLEGSLVEKGQLLYSIDPRPFEAAVAKAKASLAEAEANHARAVQDVARYEPLVAKRAVSREEYETAVALERAARAAVDAAKATVDGAEIDLSYTRVTAPEVGLIGKTEVHPGTLVGRGLSTLLTRISRIDPIHVRFSIPERDYLAFARKKGEGVPREADADLPFDLLLADGTVHAEKGRFFFVERSVDPRTGTILLEASFPNPRNLLRPGQYARVRCAVEVKKGAILVPQRAVQEIQGVYSVAVVVPDGTVDQRLVKPAERVGSLWAIDSGLNPGERIVVEGLQKIRPGMRVEAKTVPIDEEGEPPSESR
jgi:membrane fusion protein (multidrug efflux system)